MSKQALKPCPDCGREVSPSAKHCPQCGAFLKAKERENLIWSIIGLVLLVLAVVFVIIVKLNIG